MNTTAVTMNGSRRIAKVENDKTETRKLTACLLFFVWAAALTGAAGITVGLFGLAGTIGERGSVVGAILIVAAYCCLMATGHFMDKIGVERRRLRLERLRRLGFIHQCD